MYGFSLERVPCKPIEQPALHPQVKIPEFTISSINAVPTVLEKAGEDNRFLTVPAEHPKGILASYDLTPEHPKDLVDGTMESIEKWMDPFRRKNADVSEGPSHMGEDSRRAGYKHLGINPPPFFWLTKTTFFDIGFK